MNELENKRKKVFEQMEEDSMMLLYSGIELHRSLDDYYDFSANKQFYYLTGLNRDNMALLLRKSNGTEKTTLFIEEPQPFAERWYGKKVTVDEAKEISGIDNVVFIDTLEGTLDSLLTRTSIYTAYFDTYKHTAQDLPDYNLVKAREFVKNYPAIKLKNAYDIIVELRMVKSEDEITRIKKAVEITNEGLKNVLKNIKPGMYEYQVQADFEYMIKYLGASGPSFNTIAGSGYNGTMLHYETNHCECKDNELILLDLGAKYDGYCADITRTYPINGKYTKRQKEIYDIVLSANREVARSAKPGMTLVELNNICKKVLAEGLIRIGLIGTEEEVSKYYMHGVSHHLGADVHDATSTKNGELRPGCVITNEPGLYIDEESIGIRIEDDLLITEDGCIVLSEDIIRTTEEIEAFMAAARA